MLTVRESQAGGRRKVVNERCVVERNITKADEMGDLENGDDSTEKQWRQQGLWLRVKRGLLVLGSFVLIWWWYVRESLSSAEWPESVENVNEKIVQVRAEEVRGSEIRTLNQHEASAVLFVQLGAQYLMNALQPNGRFAYNVRENLEFDEFSYNVLRHAGATFALASYAGWRHADRDLIDDVRKSAGLAATYLVQSFVKPIHVKQPDLLGVWDEPMLLSRRGRKRRCAKLGGAGLGLVALLSTEAIHFSLGSNETFLDISDMERIGNFILYLQRDDGSFVSRYCEDVGKDSSFVSLYYPGEAALGLVLLFERTGVEKYFHSAVKAIRSLYLTRKDAKRVEADHWAMLASERIWSILVSRKEQLIVKAEILSHARQVVKSLTSGLLDGRTTPLATRLEGVTAVLEFLNETSEDNGIRDGLDKFCRESALLLLGSQIKSDDLLNGGVPSRLVTSGDRLNVRIDFVQHAISGVMHTVDLNLL